MNCLLCALNAKYTHTNLAIRSLKAYAQSPQVQLAEYTINQTRDAILKDIFLRQPQVVGFSCYIWNIGMVLSLAARLKTVLPDCRIFLGGPEVSYDAQTLLAEHPYIDFVIIGEGEAPFRRFMAGEAVETIPGIVSRKAANAPACPVPLEEIPFPYGEEEDLSNHILYYETQRGCPFSCQYCLSSVEHGVRFLPMERVRADLGFFLKKRVRQVKFVDRTFNCNKKHAMAIWQYLIENDNGITNFHMEMAAHLMDDEVLELLKGARKGLFQFEIGVQSTHEPTLEAIQRTGDFADITYWTGRVKALGTIHQHLDLIAGLPYEDYETFGHSFDDVYRLGMEQLQLGFLKLLKGSGLRQKAGEYGIRYEADAPYEVLGTPWLSYRELLRLKNIEEMTETFFNSGKALHTAAAAVADFGRPFAFYEALADWWEEEGLFALSHSKEGLYTNLYRFLTAHPMTKDSAARYGDLLKYDMLLNDRLSRLPNWLAEETEAFAEKRRAFFRDKEKTDALLPHLKGLNVSQLARRCIITAFDHRVTEGGKVGRQVLLFDYDGPNGVACHELEGFEE